MVILFVVKVRQHLFIVIKVYILYSVTNLYIFFAYCNDNLDWIRSKLTNELFLTIPIVHLKSNIGLARSFSSSHINDVEMIGRSEICVCDTFGFPLPLSKKIFQYHYIMISIV